MVGLMVELTAVLTAVRTVVVLDVSKAEWTVEPMVEELAVVLDVSKVASWVAA
jgi:hypothetical protein